ncbi:MAG: hypothetical protein WBV22_08030 [Anaerolineaceae bacterium]
MLYFLDMIEDHKLWSGWVLTLKEQGLNELVAGLIKAGEPLSIVLSQLMFFVEPMVSFVVKDNSIKAFIDLLEDSDELAAFSRALRSDWPDL